MAWAFLTRDDALPRQSYLIEGPFTTSLIGGSSLSSCSHSDSAAVCLLDEKGKARYEKTQVHQCVDEQPGLQSLPQRQRLLSVQILDESMLRPGAHLKKNHLYEKEIG